MYIRTKDGIVDLNRTYLDGSPIYNLDTKENVIKANENGEERDCYYIENNTIYGYWYSDGCIWDEHIIKQSDNLSELCDCLMIVDEDGDFFITQVYKINIPYYIKDKKCFGCIKIELPNGAIRIEPVAKMNDDGKLVLI